MRTSLLIAALLAVTAATPQRIVFTRVFPNAGQIGLFVAGADGSDEHPLLAVRDVDYDPVWSPDGRSIVFTSERAGSADLFRVAPDGSALERLTDKRRASGFVVARWLPRRVSQAAYRAAHDVEEDVQPQSRLRADAHEHAAVVQSDR